METVLWIVVIGFAILQIVMIVKFFQIAGDLRAIRQSMPQTAKISENNPDEVMKAVKRAKLIGNNDYALSILNIMRNELSLAIKKDNSDKSYLEKWLSIINEAIKDISNL